MSEWQANFEDYHLDFGFEVGVKDWEWIHKVKVTGIDIFSKKEVVEVLSPTDVTTELEAQRAVYEMEQAGTLFENVRASFLDCWDVAVTAVEVIRHESKSDIFR